jgi:AGCS family alanine or glycine:cation symporter
MMETFNSIIEAAVGYIWATPIIILILGSSIYFTILLRFTQVRKLGHQLSLMTDRTRTSTAGISPFAAFCSIVAYRVGTANVAGVAVAVWAGGPGAVFWMFACSMVNAAISYAECSLGQVYKICQDGEYRGGAYYYIERGLGWKPAAVIYALLTLICVDIFTVGPHANSISQSLSVAFDVPVWTTGIVVALLLFAVITGGIQRISKTAMVVVPIMTLLYLGTTVALLAVNASAIPEVFSTILSSAFGAHAVYGGLLGTAVLWGVKRSVNSSGAGMGEAVPAAAAADCDHPGESGLVNSFSVFIDITVCICTGLIILLTDCFNVRGADGIYLHIGEGSRLMAELAKTDTAGIAWTQEGVSTLFSSAGATVVAICLFFFAFTTLLNYYYQGETAIAYLLFRSSEKARRTCIWALRIVMPLVFVFCAVNSAGATWYFGDFGVGVMVWFNVIILLIMSKTIAAIYNDYEAQYRAGQKPVFNPEKLGIRNAELWMEINKDKFKKQG